MSPEWILVMCVGGILISGVLGAFLDMKANVESRMWYWLLGTFGVFPAFIVAFFSI